MGAHHEFLARRTLGRLCHDFIRRIRRGLPRAQAGRLGRQGFQIPQRPDHAGAAAALPARGSKHLRLVIGNWMGGMHAWIWAVRYPDMMDAVVPMASQPTAMAARNWMLRRMMIETIKNDPDYNGGNYTAQPRMMKYAINAYQIATGGGTLGYQTLAATTAQADKMVDDRLGAPVTADATDFLYQWEASHDYDPSGA